MARLRAFSALTVLAGTVAGLLLAQPAAAQLLDNQVLKPTDIPQNNAGPTRKAPAGVPGAQSDSGSAAPADHIPLDMPPTQALFDAINRGDASGARDALNRGADIDARNVLGMTPLDSAIDLGRNDISFMLLSMRGTGSGGSQPPSAATAAAAAAAASKPAKPVRVAREPRHATERVAASARNGGAAPPAAAQAPRLFADDGGTPAPQVGFLGFGSRSR